MKYLKRTYPGVIVGNYRTGLAGCDLNRKVSTCLHSLSVRISFLSGKKR